MTRAYEEIIDFIAAGTSPDRVAAFQPSDEARGRVDDLLAREKDATLTDAEAFELEQYAQLEHIMRLAKARARHYLASAP
jgi:hypothetical protein